MQRSVWYGLIKKERNARNKVDRPTEDNHLPHTVPLDGRLVADFWEDRRLFSADQNDIKVSHTYNKRSTFKIEDDNDEEALRWCQCCLFMKIELFGPCGPWLQLEFFLFHPSTKRIFLELAFLLCSVKSAPFTHFTLVQSYHCSLWNLPARELTFITRKQHKYIG